MRNVLYQSCLLLLALAPLAAAAQEVRTVTDGELGYVLELPSINWRAVIRPDGVHRHTTFIYGGANDALLRIRMEFVDAGIAPLDLAQKDREQELRSLPGYVENNEERFVGRMSGNVISYEYTSGGKLMAGRIYYLRADARTIYTLQFTGMRDRLLALRGQADFIARSFHLNPTDSPVEVQNRINN
ncbi:MAG: hypothetical protein WCB68_19080 [Pyrinomonadaceae bacterium]